MRVVIVSRDAPEQVGVVVPREFPDREKVVREATSFAVSCSVSTDVPLASSGMRDKLIDAGLIERPKPVERDSGPERGALAYVKSIIKGSGSQNQPAVDTGWEIGIRISLAYLQGYARGIESAAAPAREALTPWQNSVSISPFVDGDILDSVATTFLGAALGSRSVWPTSASLFGFLERDDLRRAVLNADGGYSRIHLVRLDRARQALKRQGGGVVEEGMYLEHPKRDGVLVPFRTYHADLLAEMTREVRVVLGRMGAKSLKIETVEGITFGGEVVSRFPLKSGAVSVDSESSNSRRVVYEWGSPTFDPGQALADCVWIQDNAGVMTIVDQRRTSNLTRYEEFSKVDTSFRISVDVMKLFAANFAWSETSTYRYEVEFFDKSLG